MTDDVRIEIEDYEGMSAAVQDKILFIVIRVLNHRAKDAGIRLRHISSGRRYICVSPGTPESFHEKP